MSKSKDKAPFLEWVNHWNQFPSIAALLCFTGKDQFLVLRSQARLRLSCPLHQFGAKLERNHKLSQSTVRHHSYQALTTHHVALEDLSTQFCSQNTVCTNTDITSSPVASNTPSPPWDHFLSMSRALNPSFTNPMSESSSVNCLFRLAISYKQTKKIWWCVTHGGKRVLTSSQLRHQNSPLASQPVPAGGNKNWLTWRTLPDKKFSLQ